MYVYIPVCFSVLFIVLIKNAYYATMAFSLTVNIVCEFLATVNQYFPVVIIVYSFAMAINNTRPHKTEMNEPVVFCFCFFFVTLKRVSHFHTSVSVQFIFQTTSFLLWPTLYERYDCCLTLLLTGSSN